ncbi:MAG: DUF5946 family protein [Thermoleophilaceae bacterium]
MNDPDAIGPLKPAEATACPGCAAVLPEQQGPTHAYMRSSPAMLEQSAAPGEGPKLHKRMVDRPAFTWLDPPDMAGRMTASDLLAAATPAEHERLVRAWAADVWTAWTPHHATVRAWLEQSLP